MQKIVPFLWFNDQAEEAAKFYVSTFANSKLGTIHRWGEGAPAPKGSVMTVSFQLEGQELTAFNGGPTFTFTPAISLVVNCNTQEEVDQLWEKLSAGGTKERCGWLKDKFGLSWQVIPVGFVELLQDPRAMKAMLEMDKLDLKRLKQAAGR